MTVGNLIKRLKEFNPEQKVMIDITRDGASMFHMVSASEVEEIQIPDAPELGWVVCINLPKQDDENEN